MAFDAIFEPLMIAEIMRVLDQPAFVSPAFPRWRL